MDNNLLSSLFQLNSDGWLRELNFRESHYKAIGKLAVEFSALEFFVSYYIWILNNENDTVSGQVITSKLSIVRLLPIMAALYRLRDRSAERNEELGRILAEIETLRQRRNDIIHAIWNYDYQGNKATRSKTSIDPKTILKMQSEVLSIPEIEKIGNDLTHVIFKLHSFMQQLIPPRSTNTNYREGAGG